MHMEKVNTQISKHDDENVNNESLQNELCTCTNEKPETYIPDESELKIWEYDTIPESGEPPDGYYYPVEDLNIELQLEVEQQLRNYTRFFSDPENPECHRYLLWNLILRLVDGYLNSQELYAINYCLGNYASVCWPEEKREEICKNIYRVKDWFKENKLDGDVLERKILEMRLQIFYELTEILLKSDVINYCVWVIKEPSYYQLLRNDFKFTNS